MYLPPRAMAAVQRAERCIQNVPFGMQTKEIPQITKNRNGTLSFMSITYSAHVVGRRGQSSWRPHPNAVDATDVSTFGQMTRSGTSTPPAETRKTLE